ncbi:hypothetical protein AN6661.2 [Aspergillus nidulans FGSC A4]|uniref:Uncharacterized protein n=1 Tax=Emericella nidulans (strain FGSC A4 / ATCC 38163 / CBS 112.46 / NRRL 194 / M139) TaxID=227321 RepID=Q5AYG9_EMENI|nr:hypothetical protein [Aspergillus nidulans FGSC A4]EAA58190.1 hypothetical protein AN6661.2 [Aspergillus nidulans FGSC A4]CBF71198.1 TPA: hypothetical protein ANIA_06661 [Aspergillus nidulans FGSC A4]|eukprot:XP_664265.1 hypothetical protein AN6661.2 [Aspergillus nidulans FGSC A4]
MALIESTYYPSPDTPINQLGIKPDFSREPRGMSSTPRISISASMACKPSNTTTFKARQFLLLIKAHFSILKHLLQSGSGIVHATHEPSTCTLTVHVDRTKFQSHGKPALADYLCRLHIWRCTADVSTCKEYYERLYVVDGIYEEWRQIWIGVRRLRIWSNSFIIGFLEAVVQLLLGLERWMWSLETLCLVEIPYCRLQSMDMRVLSSYSTSHCRPDVEF